MTRDEAGEVTLPFGKHRDKMLKDVPRDYLRWLHEDAEIKKDELRTALSVWMGSDEQDAQGAPNDADGGGEDW